jgi:hypothetical protein
MKELHLACTTGKDYANNPESNESVVFLIRTNQIWIVHGVNIGTK